MAQFTLAGKVLSVVSGSTNIVLGGNVNVTGDVYGGGWYGNDLIKS